MNPLDAWAIPLKLNCQVHPKDYLELTPMNGGCTLFMCCEYNQIACIDLSVESLQDLLHKITEILEAHK